jgi:hypothetical protein
VDAASQTRFPARQFLSACHGFVKDIDRAAPNLEVVKLVWGQPGLCEDVGW